MNKYKVYIYEQPFEYVVKAETKGQAELIAVKQHNDGNYEDIYKTEIIILAKVK